MTYNFQQTTIGEICNVVTDGSHYSPKSVTRGEYMVSVKDFTPFGFDFSGCRQISKSDYDDLVRAGCVPEKDDILIGKDGARFFEDIVIYRQPQKPALLSSIAILRANKTMVEPEYLYYMLKSPLFKKDVRENYGSGSAIPRIILKDFRRMPVEIPPLPVQKHVAAILSSLDSRIANNSKINHHLEQMAQAIFKSWFVDFEPFDGEMPSNWRVVDFSTFLTPRIEKSSDPDIPLFSVTDTGIYPRGKKFNKNLSKAGTKNKIARKTDLVFGMSREILNWGVMRSAIGGVSSAYNVFAVDSGINSKYLESFINAHSLYFKDLIRPATREGQGVDKGALMLKSIYLPPDRILADYYVIEDALTEQMREKEAESARLTALRDTLLPRLMSGELSSADLDAAK